MASSGPPHPDTHHSEEAPPDYSPAVSTTPASSTTTSASPPAVTMAGATAASPQKTSHQQGQPFEPLDKASSQTVKLNPKLELSLNDLLRLLSYMEGELQSRDVVIATLKTERVKNLLQYGRVGLSDPFLALQRDSIGGSVVRGGGVNEAELRALEETQLAQLEHLIAQQRKAHQRMRHVLREAEKELEAEKAAKKKVEKELRKVQETLEEERGRQKQIILMLVEERKRLALQYMEERKRSEDLAQILSEEKGRIDSMAEGLEEESKKSLQMEAELEKQLADFDTERQQMRGQLTKKEERINELEALLEKQQREVDHYKKQLQEAHNVAMFQQTLSVSPPRIGIAARPAPPQLPAKPATLTQPQPRMSATGIARGVQPGVGLRPVMYSVSTSEVTRTVTTAAKSYSVSENEAGWTGGSEGEGAGIVVGGVPGAVERGVVRVTGPTGEPRSQAQVVQVTPRVNVSASPGTKVITTTHGGKVTFHVTANAPTTTTAPAPPASNGQQQQTLTQTSTMIKKPPPPTRTTQPGGPPPPVPLNKPTAAPPVPPNKPAVPPKKDLVTRVGAGGQGVSVEPGTPISVEVKPQKVGPQTVKFGITISKTAASGSGSGGQSVGSGGGGGQAVVGVGSGGSGGGSETPVAPSVEGGAVSPRRDAAQVGGGGPPVHATACVDSLSPELEHFHQLLISMAGSSDVAVPAISNLVPPSNPSSAPNTHVVCSSPSQSSCTSLPSVPSSGPSSPLPPSLSPPPHHSASLTIDHEGLASPSSSTVALSLPPPLPAFSSLNSPSSVAAASVTMAHSSPHCTLFSSSPTVPVPRLTESPHQSSTSLCTPSRVPSSSPSTTTTLNYHHYSPSTTTTTITTTTTTTTTTLSPSGSLPPPLPLPLDDCPIILTPVEGEDLEPPHSPLDVSTPLTMDGMTALHLAAQGNNWHSFQPRPETRALLSNQWQCL